MKNPEPVSKPTGANEETRTPFKKMSPGQKTLFICKVIVCIVSFGFVYPNGF